MTTAAREVALPEHRPVPVLTVVVPCYNSAAYLTRCLDSLLQRPDRTPDLQIVVVDDGSIDATAELAAAYATRHPHLVEVLGQPNGGHGAAINTGIVRARGAFIKIVDSDDWVDGPAFDRLLHTLRQCRADPRRTDVVITNYVYEKADRRRPRPVRYADVLPSDRPFGWHEVGRFAKRQYMLMHALVYRTELLRECALRLPEHTFYVDNLYAYLPLPSVCTLYYLNVDLYRYHIGRADQSVNETVMMDRVDQQLSINRAMLPTLHAVRRDRHAPRALRRYLLHYFEIVSAVSSILLIRTGTRAAMAKKDAFWQELRIEDPALYRRLRRGVVGQLTHLPGRPGRRLSVLAYKAAQWAVGFN